LALLILSASIADLSHHLATWNNKQLIQKADITGSTPLHLLASTNDKCIMKLLLDLDPSAGYHADNEGSLPIHVAAANGSLDVVKLLSDHRPSCSWACNNIGQTILHIAVKNGSSNVVKYVCSGNKFARIINTRDKDGNTALHLAVLEADQFIFCRLMRKKEVSLSITNKKERTPLDLAQLSLQQATLLQVRMYY
jgi:ankyrin repeat protein